MSESGAKELAKELREGTLSYLWRQWRAVGATVSTSRPAMMIVDPEALILMSLWMLPDEARLGDVIWSWVEVNSPLVSTQRLGNLRGSFPPAASHRLSALAEHRMVKLKDPRWKSLRSGTIEKVPARENKVRAVEPRLDSWATLMLQLRLGLGVGVKADALTFVLGLNPNLTEWVSVSMIAEALGYTTTAVRRGADDLARSRFIRLLDTAESAKGSRRMFSGQSEEWARLLGLSRHMFGWGFWWERYRFVVDALTWLDAEAAKPSSAYVRDVKAREILNRHAMALRKHNMVDPQEFGVAELNMSYLAATIGKLRQWLENYG